MNKDIEQRISSFIREYTEMDIKGTVIPCPYWMNKMAEGKVVMRGFANGKGDAKSIRTEVIKRLEDLPVERQFSLNPQELRKFARRQRIGIDCSGFVYRVLDMLVQLRYQSCQAGSLDNIFPDGINRTNVRKLTDPGFCVQAETDYRLGDMIRLMGGRHLVIITGINDTNVTYAHSDFWTEIQGVHSSVIQIKDRKESLEYRLWIEKTRNGENYGKKYYWPGRGDGVYRLKIFN